MQHLITIGKFITSEELYDYVGVTAIEVHSFQTRLKTIIDNYHKHGELDTHHNQGCFRRFANSCILKTSQLWKVISCWVVNVSHSQIKT